MKTFSTDQVLCAQHASLPRGQLANVFDNWGSKPTSVSTRHKSEAKARQKWLPSDLKTKSMRCQSDIKVTIKWHLKYRSGILNPIGSHTNAEPRENMYEISLRHLQTYASTPRRATWKYVQYRSGIFRLLEAMQIHLAEPCENMWNIAQSSWDLLEKHMWNAIRTASSSKTLKNVRFSSRYLLHECSFLENTPAKWSPVHLTLPKVLHKTHVERNLNSTQVKKHLKTIT